jgi:hypothetical protein
MSGSTSRWTVTVGMLVMLLVPTAVVAAVLVGASGPDGPDAPPAAVLPVVPSASEPEAVSRANQESTVGASRRVDSHQVMLEQMRVNVTPQMIQSMNGELLAHSPAELAELERQAADIDRMLARDP